MKYMMNKERLRYYDNRRDILANLLEYLDKKEE